MTATHGFDYRNPAVCRCGDPQNQHLIRPLTLWTRLRVLLYDLIGRWCPHIEQIPTAAVGHPAHNHSSDAAPAEVGDPEAILFCLDCWASTPTSDERAVAAVERLVHQP